jgi:hypothetical protein
MNRRLTLTLSTVVLAGSVLSISQARADQPNMRTALGQLQAAKASLEAANINKAGHRVNAIRLIDQAIVEVQMGINAAH